MISCPIKECGRKFQNDETMLEHVRRRHPNQYSAIKQDLTKSLIEKQHAQQQQMNKLPKLAKLMSRQKKNTQMPTRSDSKSKKIDGGSANLSNIIQQSRQITAGTSKTTIATRRPSLTKKLSANDLNKDLKLTTLAPIQGQIKKTAESYLVQKKSSINSNGQTNQQFYTTLPNFKAKNDVIIRSKSKGKKKSLQKSSQQSTVSLQQQPTNAPSLRNTMTALAVDRTAQDAMGIEKKKNILRPVKKVQKRPSQKLQKQEGAPCQQKVDFEQKILTVKGWGQSVFACPNICKVQYLYLNNCNLSSIVLNSLQSLIQLSATGNKLVDMQFLRYQKNGNLKIVHLDHNELAQIYTPPRLKVFTASFNSLKSQSLHQISGVLKRSPQLQQIDFSFNNLRKAKNYKLHIISQCQKIKKIDGLTVTKMDKQMMEQYKALESKHKGLIPLGSPSQQRPQTAVSVIQQFQPQTHLLSCKQIWQLQAQKSQYQKLIRDTQEQLKVIQQQNQILEGQLQLLENETASMAEGSDGGLLALLKKLQKECQFLQLLNVVQHADQEELSSMVNKKKLELGIMCQ